jgi:GT2 family glycosyltransferase
MSWYASLADKSAAPWVGIVVLNYQNAPDTIACVTSLKGLSYPHYSIVVVDNYSQDGSAEAIAHAHPDITLIAATDNTGYSGGNNIGIQAVLANPKFDYVWLLNNDTTVDPEALTGMVDLAQSNPPCLIGAQILYPDGRFQRVGNRLDRRRGKLVHYPESSLCEGMTVESLTGCSMLISRAIIDTVGLLDERYFLYFEDNDYCFQAQTQGIECRVALNAKIYHQEGATTKRQSVLTTYYYQRNRLALLQRMLPGDQFRRIESYTRFRLFRSKIKTALKPFDTDAKRHHRAFELAVMDFKAGRLGKCQHML